MIILIFIVSLISLAVSGFTLVTLIRHAHEAAENLSAKDQSRELDDTLSRLKNDVIINTQTSVKSLGELLDANQRTRSEAMNENLVQLLLSSSNRQDEKSIQISRELDDMSGILAAGMKASLEDIQKQFSQIRQEFDTKLATGFGNIEKRLSAFTTDSGERFENIRQTVDRSLHEMRDDNNKKLEEMRKTVDEKLQTEFDRRIKESFNTVSGLLERVQKDIGNMRSLAEDVGGLKKTLSNVKTRGMMGEFQLESILSDVFSHDQFIKNAHPDPVSPNVVEFALKIPTDDGESILLPIDSKFPNDRYEAVLEASEGSDKALLNKAIKDYTDALKIAAKDISQKYIVPPYTTDFALLFLPTESMYADAVNRDMLPEIWRSYKVYITGPSTISALLSSMQLAFNNMAIQKRAGEVFSILSEVQNEFGKFEEVLQKMQKHLDSANKDLSDLMGVRSRKINSRLGSIRRLSAASSQEQTLLPPIIDAD